MIPSCPDRSYRLSALQALARQSTRRWCWTLFAGDGYRRYLEVSGEGRIGEHSACEVIIERPHTDRSLATDANQSAC